MKEQHNVKFLLHRREKKCKNKNKCCYFRFTRSENQPHIQRKTHDANEIKSKKANNQSQRILKASQRTLMEEYCTILYPNVKKIALLREQKFNVINFYVSSRNMEIIWIKDR